MRTISPLKAIRLNCLDCVGGSRDEVKKCEIKDCPLYKFRFGKNPNCANRKGNPEALLKWRESQLNKQHDDKSIIK
jgi:hypothetical protein